MDISRIDLIIQYSLVIASGLEDYRQRELGPIHFIKYVYLADLAYAKEHAGQTYTGASWRFYHFGPWTEQVFERVGPALLAIGAQQKTIAGPKDDFYRWSLAGHIYGDEVVAEELERKLGFVVALDVKRAVLEYGSDTYRLLNDVYLSPPMLVAAPGETLNFSYVAKKQESIPAAAAIPAPILSAKQIKKRSQKRDAMKAALSERLERKKAVRAAVKAKSSDQPNARYDDVFFEGLNVLDKMAGEPIQEESVTCSISDKIWKSKARHDPDLS